MMSIAGLSTRLWKWATVHYDEWINMSVLGGRVVGALLVLTVVVNLVEFKATDRHFSLDLLWVALAWIVVTVPIAAFRVWNKDYERIAELRQEVAVLEGPAKPSLVAKIYFDKSIGVFPFADGRQGWYTKAMLLVHIKNKGAPSIVTELRASVTTKDRAPITADILVVDQIVPTSTDEDIRFRSVSYIAENAITSEHAANVYVYVELPNVAYENVDRTTWEVTFKDAHDGDYVARPTPALVEDANKSG